MKLVTSYPTPDLDGVACTVAYAEFLRKQGEEAVGAVFGDPDREAARLAEQLGVELEDGTNHADAEEVVLVDACRMGWISNEIDPSRVVKAIDHQRKHIELDHDFELDNRLVGAAATIIASYFFEEDIEMSEETAALLYGAILDNTVDFQADVTTEEEKKTAERLERKIRDPAEISEVIFETKSELGRPLEETVRSDYYWMELGGERVGISQLEARGAKKFGQEKTDEIIAELELLEKEDDLEHVFMTVFDIELGENWILAGKDMDLLADALPLEDEGNMRKNRIPMLRKQIKPRLEEEIGER